MRRSWVLTTVVGLGVGACTGDSAPVGGAPEWTLGEAVFSVGGLDEREEYQFTRVADATRLSDGRIAIADAGASTIRYYAADGTHLYDSGAPGEGPGEFGYIFHLTRLPGDTLLVTAREPGFTWLDPTGEYLRSEPVVLWSVRIPCRIAESEYTTLEDGTLIYVFHDNFYGSDCPSTPASPWQETALIAHVDLLEGTLDTLGIIPGTERNSPNYRVYGRIPLVATAPGAVYAAESGWDRILKLGFGGDTLAVLPAPFSPRTIPDSAKRERVREFERNGVMERGNPYLYPERFPALGRLVASEDGTLWVMAYPDLATPMGSMPFAHAMVQVGDPNGGTWRVLDDTGAVLGELRTPPGFFPLEIGADYILGVSRDEFDVATVSLYEILRPRGGP